MSKCDTVKTILMMPVCEITRVPGRIKNRQWGWMDISTCECAQANPVVHVLSVVSGAGVAAALVGAWPLTIVAVVIALAKARVWLKKLS